MTRYEFERARSDAAERDLAGAEPAREVGLLKESGLLTLLIPADLGGAGESWLTANAAP